MADSDPVFTKWAIHQITYWKRTERISSNLLHIHGDNDRIFRIKYVSPDYIIPGGTHFMTVSKNEEAGKVIRDALKKLSFPSHQQN